MEQNVLEAICAMQLTDDCCESDDQDGDCGSSSTIVKCCYGNYNAPSVESTNSTTYEALT